MPRPPSEDADLWRRAMTGVAPLRPAGRGRPDRLAPAGERPVEAVPEILAAAREARRAHAPVPAVGQAAPPLFAGVDRRTAERLRRGRFAVEARLDLHGMTQNEAHRALSGFVATARGEGRRCVLVITGHGRLSGGILKAVTPRWLAEPALRSHVLAIAPARPPHGGDGALYVLLRRAGRGCS